MTWFDGKCQRIDLWVRMLLSFSRNRMSTDLMDYPGDFRSWGHIPDSKWSPGRQPYSATEL